MFLGFFFTEVETELTVCEAIRKSQTSELDACAQNASPEVVAAGVVTVSLMGACMNLVGC